MNSQNVKAIVLAAGQGKRMGTEVPKQYLLLEGHELLYYSLKAFEESPVDEVVLVTGADEISWCQEHLVERYGFTKVKKIIAGGKERYDSVYAGLLAAAPCDYVLIHDGARPLITEEILCDVFQGTVDYGCCTTGMPVKDTIKVVDEEDMAEDTPDRKSLWAIHTPQGFSYPFILEAHEKFREGSFQIPVTDDTMLVELFLRKRTKLVKGSYRNIKVTTPEDMELAQVFLKSLQRNQKG
ncbi:MAG: 2-C-methyl-D-erythritol 4-phosphate cytidylyltransferase [Lachnospiraceae bacterium]|nr:2-C-methyl-D-erythritol 4-phosphate cytidylyltransferase [Lachnospiraceae bacterium]